MIESASAVAIKILDKEYRVSCQPENRAVLVEAARYLNDKMREIRSTGKVIGLERIAVMAALNISHELLQSRQQISSEQDVTHQHIEQLLGKLNNVLESTDG
ncbi:MAG: cell division protein ZapA [Candidatus Endonucleobacter bathymodioli]|uniref:Cell division protein ZapA n=1 Tax=Candidatus Endonucleibacter bathymodioli TaxID=539814 RepID=A0AA90SU10_9GAMM|nr:cell division protein ZapA [Candidatus Endonucleobacter bathymodioli]